MVKTDFKFSNYFVRKKNTLMEEIKTHNSFYRDVFMSLLIGIPASFMIIHYFAANGYFDSKDSVYQDMMKYKSELTSLRTNLIGSVLNKAAGDDNYLSGGDIGNLVSDLGINHIHKEGESFNIKYNDSVYVFSFKSDNKIINISKTPEEINKYLGFN